MLPMHTRVAAIDDNEDHLQKIMWGLGKAGFSPLPFQFSDGKLEGAPSSPIPGIRLVFSDIHIVPFGQNNDVVNAINIVRCLKAIVGTGPYAIIFWSQFPGDMERIRPLIEERALEQKISVPLAFGSIDKKVVFDVNTGDQFNAIRLRDLILDQIANYKSLAIAASWDSRVAAAAATTTNQLFQLAGEGDHRLENWNALLAYLATEAAGYAKAKENPKEALDSALLPLLEDQLSLIGRGESNADVSMSELSALLDVARPRLPNSIRPERLNSSYLIEEFQENSSFRMHERGVVTRLGSAFINSGEFLRAFGLDDKSLILAEFVQNPPLKEDEFSKLKLYAVEVGPECDHVQGKVSTHKYLLSLLVPASLLKKCAVISKSGDVQKYKNLSILDSGPLTLSTQSEPHHLLISCRCFMALGPGKYVDGKPVFRLRKDLLNEVLHCYTTHARRPGVMRFA